MAITGDSYCRSAWNGFLMNTKHLIEYQLALFLASLFVVLGKLMIAAANGLTFWLIVTYATKEQDNANSIIGSLVIVILFSLITASIFLSQFDEAALATLMSMAIDQELNNGEPKFGPPTYHDKLNKIFHRNKMVQNH